MSRRKHIIGFGLLVAAATTVPAYAQQPTTLPTAQTMAADFPVCTKKASDGDQEIAKQKFIAGRQDYEEGTYDSAIKRFKTAYDLDCSKPELLLIISSAFEKKGDKQAALAALEVYTQRAPKDAPDMATTLNKIENMKQSMKTAPPPTASSGPPKDEVQEHSVLPWVAVGIGGVALVTGVIFHLTHLDYPEGCDPDAKPTAESTTAGPKCTRMPVDDKAMNKDALVAAAASELKVRQDDAGITQTFKRTGTVLIIAGSVFVVGGLIWHFVEPTGPKSTGKNKNRRFFTPEVSPGYGGLSFGGTF